MKFPIPNSPTHRSAFTLVELMAVVMVIALLLGVLLGTANYVQRRAGVSTTRAELYAIAAALEMYKADYGNYPLSNLARYGEDYSCEKSNSWVLFRALIAGPKKYLNLNARLLLPDAVLLQPADRYITDSFGTPLNYYFTYPPVTTLTYTNWYAPAIVGIRGAQTNFLATGGQVNTLGFDLFSYGPDRQTYLPNLPLGGATAATGFTFNDPNMKTDDIWYNKR